MKLHFCIHAKYVRNFCLTLTSAGWELVLPLPEDVAVELVHAVEVVSLLALYEPLHTGPLGLA